MAASETRLLEQLLLDRAFREQFQRDPEATARAAGLEQLADELAVDDADPMETLEPRESRSSLAGVLMAAAVEGIALYEGGHHLLPPIEAAEAATIPKATGSWAFVRSGTSFPGNHPDYAQLKGFGASGVLWDPEDPTTGAGIASSHAAGLKAGVWLVPHAGESPRSFAQRASDAIARYKPDKVVLDVEAIGKGYQGSAGWTWSEDMMNAFARLQPNPPPLAVTVEPLQDDFNYAAYTSRKAEVWPQSYLGDMTPRDPQAVVDRVAANGVPRELIVPVLGPEQLDGYDGPHHMYTADDIQGQAPKPAASPPPVVDAGKPEGGGEEAPVARPAGSAVRSVDSRPAQADASASEEASRSPPSANLDSNPFGRPGVADLLANRNLVFDASGQADLRAGRVDPRVVSLLGQLSQRHRLTISSLVSDHSRLTAGGSVSNHFHGRAFDIAVVDGRAVTPSNAAARRLALELSGLDPGIRPSEIGSPWALQGPAYFTDADHQDHIHVGFDEPIDARAVAAIAAQQPLSPDPDDWEGNLDDEDGGDDEVDGSDEDEADEGGGEDDDGGTDDEEGDDDEGGDDGDEEAEEDEDGGEGDDDQDEPGEGSSGEDADDDTSDGGSDDDDDSEDDDTDSGSGDTPDFDSVDSAYPGDDAPREQLAAWMGSAAQKRGLPAELPVMAALTESSLRNLSYGDADSVGFFQMRTSIWNQGAYSGYADKPQLQLQWFLDRAEAAGKQRAARGLSVTDPKQYGEWIADVENPAAQYRGRYQLRLAEARALLAQAEPRGNGNADLAEVAAVGDGALAGQRALAAVAQAKTFLGTPYRWGGSSPATGFDCSGLVQWVYAQVGVRIPRVTDQQILAPGGTPVDRRHLLAGDLVFFRDSTGYVHHVGISLGGHRFIHAPHTGDVVKVSSLKDSYYAQQFTGGRRFVSASSASASAADADDQRGQAEAVRFAQAALDRDAAEVQQENSELARALARQEQAESELRNAVQILRAVDPSQVSRRQD